MISAKIQGGLGNQMFIIAATYALALNNNDECAFDMDLKRKYYGVVHQGRVASSYFNSLYRKVRQLPLRWKPEAYYKEDSLKPYTPIPYSADLMIEGYFQSAKHFDDRRKEILKLFIDKGLLRGIKNRFKELLSNSVSLHVRRGDYLRFSHIYPLPNLAYYTKALCYLKNNVDVDNVLIFSDDIQWCKENLKGDGVVYIEGLEDWEEMYLMSLCSYNIISNSSFSWWGSYLNKHRNKIVVAPEQWMREDNTFCWQDIHMPQMILGDNKIINKKVNIMIKEPVAKGDVPIDVIEVIKDAKPKGIIEVGAFTGSIWKEYEKNGVHNRCWIEPCQKNLLDLRANVPLTDVVIGCAICDEDKDLDFVVTNNYQSSSFLPLKEHLKRFPHILPAYTEKVDGRSLDSLVDEGLIDMDLYDMLLMDIQGAEYYALKGFEKNIHKIKYIVAEVNYEELYEGCMLADDFDKYLRDLGFEKQWYTHHSTVGWGDSYYKRIR